MSWKHTGRITTKNALQGGRRLVRSHANPLAWGWWRHLLGFSTVFIHTQLLLSPSLSTLGLSNKWFLCFPSVWGFVISLGHHSRSVRERHQIPSVPPVSAFLRKQVMVWSWNVLLLNFTVSPEGRDNIKPSSWALWRIYRALAVTSCGTEQMPWFPAPGLLIGAVW